MAVTTGSIALKRIGIVWGVIELLVLLPVLVVFMAANEGMVMKALKLLQIKAPGQISEFLVNVLIVKVFFTGLMAVGCVLVGRRSIAFAVNVKF